MCTYPTPKLQPTCSASREVMLVVPLSCTFATNSFSDFLISARRALFVCDLCVRVEGGRRERERERENLHLSLWPPHYIPFVLSANCGAASRYNFFKAATTRYSLRPIGGEPWRLVQMWFLQKRALVEFSS